MISNNNKNNNYKNPLPSQPQYFRLRVDRRESISIPHLVIGIRLGPQPILIWTAQMILWMDQSIPHLWTKLTTLRIVVVEKRVVQNNYHRTTLPTNHYHVRIQRPPCQQHQKRPLLLLLQQRQSKNGVRFISMPKAKKYEGYDVLPRFDQHHPVSRMVYLVLDQIDRLAHHPTHHRWTVTKAVGATTIL